MALMSGGFTALGLAFKNEVQDINRSSIRMHRSGIFLIALGASLVLLGSALSKDSSDLFLNAYQDFQAAEKLEREAKPQEALKKYRSAQQILAQIRKASSDWQPLVVDYRLRKTQESIERLETGIGILPAILPIPEAPEGNLPEPEKNGRSLPFPLSRQS